MAHRCWDLRHWLPRSRPSRSHRWLGFGLALLLTVVLHIPSGATAPGPTRPVADGRSLYEAGLFREAVTVLKQEAQRFRTQAHVLQLAATLANLAQTYQQLGDFEPATAAIAESFTLLAHHTDPAALRLQAQVWEVQGQLWLAQGNSDAALTAWQAAIARYQQVGDTTGVITAQLNQAQALRSQGLFRRALALLTQITQSLQTQPNSRATVIALRSLGDTWRLVGDTAQAKTALTHSLKVAQQLQLPAEISATLLSLGNTERADQNWTGAIAAYQQAATAATSPLPRLQAHLNQLSVWLEQRQWNLIQPLIAQILPDLNTLPASRASIYARINFAQSLLRLHDSASGALFRSIPLSSLLQQTLQPAIEQAHRLQDQRAESYAIGTLGTAYEQAGQLQAAQRVTQSALVLAQSSQTWDVAYRWQWQLGRLRRQIGDIQGAIAAYDAAIANLQSLRGDLAAINPDVQFNFRDSVEPIYRQSVELLLQADSGTPSTATLETARKRIEALQLAELDNFFREACLEGQRVLLDEVVDQNNPTTTIVYPIVLRDRTRQTVNLQVIAKIPNQPLKRYAVTNLPESEFDQTIYRLQTLLAEVPNAANQTALRSQAQKLYTWLIAPLDQEIQTLTQAPPTAGQARSPKVDTLVFVLDDALRNVPLAMLWDGQQYLVEKYGIALSLGLQLFDPKPLAREPLKVLAAGLSEPPPGAPAAFGVLPNVSAEITAIARLGLPTTSLLEQNFTRSALAKQINAAPFNVVHLATHGQFSSRAENTFILAADGPINVTQFDQLLRSRDITRPEAIQLLVLSACQTATNDNRATLGLAGFAVRAGARSTLASLRNVSDESTPLLVQAFYQALNHPQERVTKAEALRRAQVALLKGPRRTYQAPQYWAAYVLIGNWL